MDAYRLPDGRLVVPVTYEAPDGSIGDALEVIDETHPDYEAWQRFAVDASPEMAARYGP